jgi:hypothetical protein
MADRISWSYRRSVPADEVAGRLEAEDAAPIGTPVDFTGTMSSGSRPAGSPNTG